MNTPTQRNASLGAYRKQYMEQRNNRIKKTITVSIASLLAAFVAFSFFNAVTIVVPQSLSGAMIPVSIKYGFTHVCMVHVRAVPDEELTSDTIVDVMKREGAALCIWPNSLIDGLGTADKLGDLKEVAAKNFNRFIVVPHSTALEPIENPTDDAASSSSGSEKVNTSSGTPFDEGTVKAKVEDRVLETQKVEEAKNEGSKASDSSAHAPEFRDVASIPVVGNVSAFIYNPNAFEKAAASIPQTSEGVLAVGRTYPELFPQGVGMWAASENDIASLVYLTDSFDQGGLDWSSATRSYMNELYMWEATTADDRIITPQRTPLSSRDEVLSAFKDGKLAGFIGSSQEAMELMRQGVTCAFVTVPGPSDDSPAVFYPRYSASILPEVGRRELNLLDWLLGDDAQVSLAHDTNCLQVAYSSDEIPTKPVNLSLQHKARISLLECVDKETRKMSIDAANIAISQLKEEDS